MCRACCPPLTNPTHPSLRAPQYPADGRLSGRLVGVFTGLAFVMAMVWMNAVATELVELLTSLGTIFQVSPAMMGAQASGSRRHGSLAVALVLLLLSALRLPHMPSLDLACRRRRVCVPRSIGPVQRVALRSF